MLMTRPSVESQNAASGFFRKYEHASVFSVVFRIYGGASWVNAPEGLRTYNPVESAYMVYPPTGNPVVGAVVQLAMKMTPLPPFAGRFVDVSVAPKQRETKDRAPPRASLFLDRLSAGLIRPDRYRY